MPLQPGAVAAGSDRDGMTPIITPHARAEEAPSMPDISLPEVHLPDFRLPEGLRDMNREDIQKAMPDVRLPKIDLPKRSDISKELAKAGRDIDKALPRRPAPSPLPFVFFGMIAGLFIGWFLASSTVTGPRIGGVVDEVRGRVAKWRAGDADDEDAYDSQPAAYPDALRSSAGSEAMSGGMADRETRVGVGPGTEVDGVGAGQGVSSERF
jgi:hypothetical protein